MNDKQADLIITPDIRVAKLLEVYPQLESTLIEIAPPFAKLKNPVLRKTVARVTSLKQAAKVGNIELGVLINRLRHEVGQESVQDIKDDDFEKKPSPDWFDPDKIVDIIDARQMLEEGDKPLALVMQHLNKLNRGKILELITPFMPAPLIDTARQKGYDDWTKKLYTDEFHTYFCLTTSDNELK
jgi:hypothetical protein